MTKQEWNRIKSLPKNTARYIWPPGKQQMTYVKKKHGPIGSKK